MQYMPFISDVELPFYMALASRKINHDKLDDSAYKVLGRYEIRPGEAPDASCRIQVHGNALTSDETPPEYYRAEGTIKNVNTIEEYRNIDKARMLQEAGQKIWDAVNDGSVYSCPSLLASFLVLSFADLKNHKFHIWFAFPALHSNPTWVPLGEGTRVTVDPSPGSSQNLPGARNLSPAESSALVGAVQAWSDSVDDNQRGFFLARRYVISCDERSITRAAPTPTEVQISWKIAKLSAYEDGFFDDTDPEDRFICFADPSNYIHAPGWMLRNLLALIKRRWALDRVQVLQYRDVPSNPSNGRSIVITLESKAGDTTLSQEDRTWMPKVTGWERNPAGKLAGVVINLAEYLDPKRLADQSVNLNLKLMKWRIAPRLNLDKIKHTKCLLLGAGTLGSYVARNLMGWGVSKITFVDNGSVSFSNPVRQPLYNFTDCLDGGAKKALRAADALSEIYPGVDSSGHVLSVPMAGHPIVDDEKTRVEFETLRSLIEKHDAIFLLMDTREARWLPTVMGKAEGKIVMNAALGFDSFVVMRHGVSVPAGADPSSQLGCYFCNDVVAPVNSVRDQTLDQQCTVTRPGVAAIASAFLVELFVSLVQHPLGPAAPAPGPGDSDQGSHPLGLIPHQVRGFLSTFENIRIIGKSYDCCSACSSRVVNEYKERGWSFVQRALNEVGYVEELAGLKEVQSRAEAAIADVEWDESDDEAEAD